MCRKPTCNLRPIFQIGDVGKRIKRNKQKWLIGVMINAMLISAGLSVYTYKKQLSVPLAEQRLSMPFARGDIPIQAFTSLMEIVSLQSQLSAIQAKDSLTAADTLLIRSSINQLHSIQSKFKNIDNYEN